MKPTVNQSRSARALGGCVLVAVAALAAGCSGFPGGRVGKGSPASTPLVTVPARLTPAERGFVTRAAAKGMYEVEVSRLAAERAVNPDVRSYAQRMVAHHTRANKELIALMSAKGVAPPKGLAADRATKLHRLASLRASAAFDHGYVRVVGVEDHRATIAMFERARRDIRDRELKAWVEKMLSAMRGHLVTAETLSATLAG